VENEAERGGEGDDQGRGGEEVRLDIVDETCESLRLERRKERGKSLRF